MFSELGKIMKLAGEMKTKLPEVQERLDESTFTTQAGGGVVSATVNGRLELVGVKIDRQLLADGDAEIIEDLIKAAVSFAQQQATEAAAEAMEELTGGMNLPGLDGLLGM